MLGFITVGFLHFISLDLPSGTQDESIIADFAVHGKLSAYAKLLPQGQKILVNNIRLGLWPGFIAILRTAIAYGGVNLPSLRFPATLAGLLCLLWLAYLIRRAHLPSWIVWAILLFGTGQIFFDATHNLRPETLVLLALIINALWIGCFRGRAFGVIAGLVAGASIGIHTAASIYTPALAFIFFHLNRHEGAAGPRLTWWGIGILSGLYLILPHIDADQSVQCISLILGRNIRLPPLLLWKWDLVSILAHELEFLGTRNQLGNTFYLSWMVFLISALGWQLRRYSMLDKGRKLLCLLSTSLLASHMLLSASDYRVYIIHIYPWLWISAFVVLTDLASGRLHLDRIDIGLTSASLFGIYTISTWGTYHWTILGLLVFLIFKTRHQRNIFFFNLCLVGLCTFFFPDFFLSIFASCAYWVRYRPGLLMVVFLGPWLLFRARGETLQFRMPLRLTQERTIACVGICVLTVFQLTDYRLMAERILSEQTLWPESHQLLMEIGAQPRVVAPYTLWIYNQSPGFQAEECLEVLRKYTSRPMTTECLSKYKPDIILWPYHSLALLKNLKGYTIKRTWNTVWGELAEMERIPAPA
jgi:hypothetical protein